MLPYEARVGFSGQTTSLTLFPETWHIDGVTGMLSKTQNILHK